MSNRAMLRRWMLAGVGAVALCTSMLLAKPGIVTTTTGLRYQGDVVEAHDTITITDRAVVTRINRADVATIEYVGTVQEQVHDRLAKLAPTDVKGRIELARFAFDEQAYDLSEGVLEDALRIDPNDADARSLMDTVQRQRRMERDKSRAPEPPPTPKDKDQDKVPAAATGAMQSRFLTPQDINTIRQSELQPGDNARVQIPNDVKRRYVESHDLDFAKFSGMRPVDQALKILSQGDADMRRQVQVMSDPGSIVAYKRLVQPVVLSGCATSNCHGGLAGGKLQLLSSADSDAATYTNFYIMQQYSKRIGEGTGAFTGAVERKLIERGHGASSLLANYGLSPTIADVKHPRAGTANYSGVFRSREDPRYKQIVNWMDATLSPLEPTYHLDFKIPGAAPTTSPVTEPSK